MLVGLGGRLRLPVGLVAEVIVIGEIGDDDAAEFERVDGTLIFVDDFTVGLDKHGVGYGGVPVGIEGGEEGVDIGGTENEIAASGVESGESGKCGGFFIGVVDADGGDFKRTMAVHAEHGLNFGHFLNAGSAPSGPEIDEAKFAGIIFAEGFELVGGSGLQGDRLTFDFGEFGFAAFFLVNPFRGAADGRRFFDNDGLAGEEGVDGFTSVATGDKVFARIVVNAALVAKLALGVEDEEVGSSGGAVGASDFLVFAIVEIDEIEMAIGSAGFHVVEGVAYIGIAHLVEAHGHGIVGLDGDDGHAAVFVIGGDLLDARFVELRGGAVIAGEGDDENFGGGVVGEAVGLAVDTGEAKIGSGGADGERGGAVFVGAGGRR